MHASRTKFKQSGKEKLKEKSPTKKEQKKFGDKISSYTCNLTNKIHLSFLLKMSPILDKLLILAGEPTKEKEDKNKYNHNTRIRWRTY
jgi:hypothetical protein